MKIKAELVIPAALKDEAIINYLCKHFDVTINISEVSFSTTTGWAILTFDGKDSEVTRCLEYLKKKGVEVKNSQNL
jgi:hypothetical protein